MPLQRSAALAQVDPDRPRDAARTDAEMAIEPAILRRDDRVDEMRAGRVRIDHPAELVPAPGKDVAVPVEHGDGPARACVERLGYIGKLDVVVARREGEDQRHSNPAAPGHAPEKAQDKSESRENPAAETAGASARRPALAPCARGCGRLARRAPARLAARLRGRTRRPPFRDQRALAPRGRSSPLS
jgi:hypothetical protein